MQPHFQQLSLTINSMCTTSLQMGITKMNEWMNNQSQKGIYIYINSKSWTYIIYILYI